MPELTDQFKAQVAEDLAAGRSPKYMDASQRELGLISDQYENVRDAMAAHGTPLPDLPDSYDRKELDTRIKQNLDKLTPAEKEAGVDRGYSRMIKEAGARGEKMLPSEEVPYEKKREFLQDTMRRDRQTMRDIEAGGGNVPSRNPEENTPEAVARHLYVPEYMQPREAAKKGEEPERKVTDESRRAAADALEKALGGPDKPIEPAKELTDKRKGEIADALEKALGPSGPAAPAPPIKTKEDPATLRDRAARVARPRSKEEVEEASIGRVLQSRAEEATAKDRSARTEAAKAVEKPKGGLSPQEAATAADRAARKKSAAPEQAKAGPTRQEAATLADRAARTKAAPAHKEQPAAKPAPAAPVQPPASSRPAITESKGPIKSRDASGVETVTQPGAWRAREASEAALAESRKANPHYWPVKQDPPTAPYKFPTRAAAAHHAAQPATMKQDVFMNPPVRPEMKEMHREPPPQMSAPARVAVPVGHGSGSVAQSSGAQLPTTDAASPRMQSQPGAGPSASPIKSSDESVLMAKAGRALTGTAELIMYGQPVGTMKLNLMGA